MLNTSTEAVLPIICLSVFHRPKSEFLWALVKILDFSALLQTYEVRISAEELRYILSIHKHTKGGQPLLLPLQPVKNPGTPLRNLESYPKESLSWAPDPHSLLWIHDRDGRQKDFLLS